MGYAVKLQGGVSKNGFVYLGLISIARYSNATYYMDMYDNKGNMIVDNAVAWYYQNTEQIFPIPAPYNNLFYCSGYNHYLYRAWPVKYDGTHYKPWILSKSVKNDTGAGADDMSSLTNGDVSYWSNMYGLLPYNIYLYGWYNEKYPDSITDIKPFNT